MPASRSYAALRNPNIESLMSYAIFENDYKLFDDEAELSGVQKESKQRQTKRLFRKSPAVNAGYTQSQTQLETELSSRLHDLSKNVRLRNGRPGKTTQSSTSELAY